MNRLTSPDLHYVVVDQVAGRPIYIFVGQDPVRSGGPRGDPVTLELLTGHKRFQFAGMKNIVPVLGQHPSGSMLFREFPSDEHRQQVGFLPITNYRICDTWLDYYDPWSSVAVDATLHGDEDDSV